MLYCTAQYGDFAGVLRLQSRLYRGRIGPAQVFRERSLARACAARYTVMMPSWPTITGDFSKSSFACSGSIKL
jgi:hypothetical protein